MKNNKDGSDENIEDIEEFILSNSKSKMDAPAAKSERQNAPFKEAEASKDHAHNVEKREKDNAPLEERSKDKSDDAGEQDALFEISEISKGNACDDDDETQGISVDKAKEELTIDKKKIAELSEQLETANDKYLRLMAEFDNFKRRSAKDYERMVATANEKLIKDIIEVRENFERAFKSNAEGEKLLEGMKLIFSKLNTILHKHGLEVYAEAGQKFDPEVHDALMRMPHEKIAEGHVVEVHERGYKLKGNIIKHAKVVVSSGKPPKKETEDEAVIEIK